MQFPCFMSVDLIASEDINGITIKAKKNVLNLFVYLVEKIKTEGPFVKAR